MKLVYALTLSFLLFVFITNLSLVFSCDDVEEVLDVDGEPVIAGKEYYIIPPFSSIGTGGGLQLEKISNSNCRVTILQSSLASTFGTTFKVTNLKNSSEKILTSTPLEIEASEKPHCTDSSKWIVFVDNDIKKDCVGIGGSGNYHNSKIVDGTFSILKHGDGYRFGFCSDGSGACFDIGSYERTDDVEAGNRLYLAQQKSKDAFQFVFFPNFFETGIIKSVA
ncbi:unnamed protein product [Lathyrus sativus]|nr:unnamed protein product [Lathyrus sativus]